MRLAAMLAFVSIIALACGDGGATPYQVDVEFNTSVTQEDIEEIRDALRSYDEDIDMLIQTSLPPTGIASLETAVPGFCATIEVELARSYVDGVTCEER